MKIHFSNKILFLCIIIFLTGCASILSTNIGNVGINSHPQGATIRIKNQKGFFVYEGKTPIIIPLKASAGFFTPAHYFITFSKDSFQQQSAEIGTKFNWISALFIPGIIVDGMTGYMFRIKDVYIQGDLKKETPVIKYDDLPKYYPKLKK